MVSTVFCSLLMYILCYCGHWAPTQGSIMHRRSLFEYLCAFPFSEITAAFQPTDKETQAVKQHEPHLTYETK